MNNCKYCFHLIKRFQRKSKFLKVDMPRQTRHDDYTKNNANTNIKLTQIKYTKALSHTRSKTLLVFIIKCLFRISLLSIYLPPRLWCCLWTCKVQICKYVRYQATTYHNHTTSMGFLYVYFIFYFQFVLWKNFENYIKILYHPFPLFLCIMSRKL